MLLCVNKMFTRIPMYLYIYTSAIPSSFLVVTDMSHVKTLDWDDSHLQCKLGCSPFITTDSQGLCQSDKQRPPIFSLSLYQFVYTTEWWHLIYMLVSKTGVDIFTKVPWERIQIITYNRIYIKLTWHWIWVHVFIQPNSCLSVINSLIKYITVETLLPGYSFKHNESMR